MKRVQQSVQQLRPEDWHAVVLELDHGPLKAHASGSEVRLTTSGGKKPMAENRASDGATQQIYPAN